MENFERTKRVTQVTEETKVAIVKNSVQALGNQPIMSAAEMKKQFVKPVVNGDGSPSAIGELNRVVTETEAALDEIVGVAIEAITQTQKTSEELNELQESLGGKADEIATLKETDSVLTENITNLQYADTVIRESVASLNNQLDENVEQISEETKSLKNKLDEVESIAKGASVPIDFDDYATMIAELNSADKSKYAKGNDIHIVTLGVPDLWVSQILSYSISYKYVSDEAFVQALKQQGRVQVGYYLLSELETGKVDLSGYEKKETHEADLAALKAMLPTVERLG